MSKKEQYRQLMAKFIEHCHSGQQTCSFQEFCRQHNVDRSSVRKVLKEEYPVIGSIPGYKRMNTKTNHTLLQRCSQIYTEYKTLCEQGQKPGAFQQYYNSFGIKTSEMYNFMHKNHLKVRYLPGYATVGKSHGAIPVCKRYTEVPFEDVIFEEAGFLPAGTNVITVSVDGHVDVSFPADTDVAVIAKFIKKMRKEVGHVES